MYIVGLHTRRLSTWRNLSRHRLVHEISNRLLEIIVVIPRPAYLRSTEGDIDSERDAATETENDVSGFVGCETSFVISEVVDIFAGVDYILHILAGGHLTREDRADYLLKGINAFLFLFFVSFLEI